MHVLILDQWKSCVQEASVDVIGEGARGCCEVNRVAWVQSVDWEGNPGRSHVQHAYSVACVIFRWARHRETALLVATLQDIQKKRVDTGDDVVMLHIF